MKIFPSVGMPGKQLWFYDCKFVPDFIPIKEVLNKEARQY
jgi:hypothetical protein